MEWYTNIECTSECNDQSVTWYCTVLYHEAIEMEQSFFGEETQNLMVELVEDIK